MHQIFHSFLVLISTLGGGGVPESSNESDKAFLYFFNFNYQKNNSLHKIAKSIELNIVEWILHIEA